MKRLLAGLVVVGLLLVPTLADSISDYGNPALVRLWRDTPEGDRFACTGSYVFPPLGENAGRASLILSAGHCALVNASIAKLARVQQSGGGAAIVHWLYVQKGPWLNGASLADFAIGVVPDIRDGDRQRLFLASKSPSVGEVVYVHGFPHGVEKVTVGQVMPTEILSGRMGEPLPAGTYLIAVPEQQVGSGRSGSPVFNANGNVAGVLWGLITPGGPLDPSTEYDIALVTPIESILDALKALRIGQ